MKTTLKRIVSTCVSVALLATTLAATAVPSSAISYSGSSSYKSGKYYTALTKVSKTGNQRTDVVNVAKSQIGYQEGPSSSKLSGTVRGSGNYTEYGRWYGVHTLWCAQFVSWCTYVAGVSTSIVPKHSFTVDGVNWFINRGRSYTRASVAAGNYKPQKGDIIYFKSSRNTNKVNHVGIVTSYSGSTVYTIEGNSSSATISTNGGAVVSKSYSISNTYIKYICKPAYKGSSSSSDSGTTTTPTTTETWSGGKGSSYTSQYYPKYTGSSGSLVTALDAKKIDSSKAFRAVIAKKNGISNYSYTPAQNTEMLNKLKKGTLLNPDYSGSSSTGGSSSTPSVTSTGEYFAKYTGTSGSIVTALNAIGVDSSKAHRAKIAAVNDIADYAYTPEQNTTMVNLLKKGKLVKPSCCGGGSGSGSGGTSSSVVYYKKYTGTSGSLNPALEAIGVDNSKAHRAKIAAANGITNYSYTPEQNTDMLNLLKKGKLICPSCCTSSYC